MKVLLNLIILLFFSLGLYWNLSEDVITTKKIINIKKLVKNPLKHEENLEVAKNLKIAEKIIAKLDKTTLDQSQEIVLGDILIKYELASEEAFWTLEDNWYSYSFIVYYSGTVVFQFNGHLNKNINPYAFEDIDIVAFRAGVWQNEL